MDLMTWKEFLNEGKEEASAIRKIIKKEFGLGARDVSVKTNSGGYSSSVDVTIKTMKAIEYIDKIESVTKDFEHYDRDERTQEILAGGNTFIFTKIDYDLAQSIKDKIQKEYMKVSKGGLKKGDYIKLYSKVQISILSDGTYELLGGGRVVAYNESEISSGVYRLLSLSKHYNILSKIK